MLVCDKCKSPKNVKKYSVLISEKESPGNSGEWLIDLCQDCKGHLSDVIDYETGFKDEPKRKAK